jgi:hypothetical protein
MPEVVGRTATGCGARTVTVDDPDLALSACKTAVIVTFPAAPGAVYRPVLVIVPVAALPPATPFTSHVTAVFDALAMLAVNCCGPPGATFAEAGETEIVIGGSGVVVEVPPPPPQPQSSTAKETQVSPGRDVTIRFFMLVLLLLGS